MHPKLIEYLDDERDIGNGVLITLVWGQSFEPAEHAGVRGFDTMNEALRARAYPCCCSECRKHGGVPEEKPAPGLRRSMRR